MDKETNWRTPADIGKNIKKAGNSVNNWIFLLTAEITLAIIAILFKTMKLPETADTGKKGSIPFIHEFSEGKKIDTSELASSFIQAAKESFIPSDLLETFSNIPKSTLSITVSVFVVTAIVLFLKIMKKKALQAELEKKYLEIKGQRV